MVASYLAESFTGITFKHISWIQNIDAKKFVQIALGAQILGGELGRVIPVDQRPYPALLINKLLNRMA